MNIALRLCYLAVASVAFVVILLLRRKWLLYSLGVLCLVAISYHYAHPYAGLLTRHLELAYSYEVFGGILIFVSSAVTESGMPDSQKRKHWAVFGAIAIIYILLGIGIRYDDVRQAGDDREELKTLKQNSTDLISAFKATFPLIVDEITEIKTRMANGSGGNIDPHTVKDLETKSEALQKLLSGISLSIPANHNDTLSNNEIRMQVIEVTGRLEKKELDFYNLSELYAMQVRHGEKVPQNKEEEMKTQYFMDDENKGLFIRANCLMDEISRRLGLPVPTEKTFGILLPDANYLLRISKLRNLASKLPL